MRKFINVILSIVVIIAFVKISYKAYQYYADKKEYKKIQEFSPIITQNIKSDEENIQGSDNTKLNNNYEIANKEEELLNINSDYRFWLNISNSNIDYPVVQGKDNDFYLSHNFNKEKSISGTLFIDCKNNIEDKNIVIYGHHMKNKTMFNNLNFFKEEEFFNNNDINIINNGIVYKYDVFSVYVIPEDEVIFNMSFSDESDYLKYIDELSSKSYFKKEVKIDPSKKMITLVTCSYEYDGARTIVHAISS